MLNPELTNIIQMALQDDCDCLQTNTPQPLPTVSIPTSTPTTKTNYVPLAIGTIILYNILK